MNVRVIGDHQAPHAAYNNAFNTGRTIIGMKVRPSRICHFWKRRSGFTFYLEMFPDGPMFGDEDDNTSINLNAGHNNDESEDEGAKALV